MPLVASCIITIADLRVLCVAGLACGSGTAFAWSLAARRPPIGHGIRLPQWVAASLVFAIPLGLADIVLIAGDARAGFGDMLGLSTGIAVLAVVIAVGIAAGRSVNDDGAVQGAPIFAVLAGIVMIAATVAAASAWSVLTIFAVGTASLAPCLLASPALARWTSRFRDAALSQVVILLTHFGALSLMSAGSVPDAAGDIAARGLIVTLVAITAAVLARTILMASEHRMGDTTPHSSDGARLTLGEASFEGLLLIEGGVIVEANKAIQEILGRRRADIVGQVPSGFFTAETRHKLALLREGDDDAIEAEVVDAFGRAKSVDVMERTIEGRAIHTTVIALRDISDQKRKERRRAEAAQTDALTGLANRVLLRDRLDQAVAIADRSGNGVGILNVDLDRFAGINDRFGHHVGDRLLIEVAKRMRGSTRDTDTLARLGSDAFAVIQPFAKQPDSAQALSKRLLRTLAEPYTIDGQVIYAPVSIGIAFHPADARSSEVLLEHADAALARAKEDGGNSVRYFDSATDARLRARRGMEDDLRQALENGELSLNFQPIVDVGRLETVGYEALLRWRSPRRGDVAPSDFLEIAEECGLGVSIGSWVLEAACAAATNWPRGLSVAVNLFGSQLRQRDLPEKIADILARNDLASERLELDVTERIFNEDTDRASAILRGVQARGVGVVLDDFGVGQASLRTLRQMSFNRVKIDRSLIAGLGGSEDAEVTVRAIFALTRSLHLDVTAEGVETDRQLSFLRSLDCERAQGFLLGRPSLGADLRHDHKDEIRAA